MRNTIIYINIPSCNWNWWTNNNIDTASDFGYLQVLNKTNSKQSNNKPNIMLSIFDLIDSPTALDLSDAIVIAIHVALMLLGDFNFIYIYIYKIKISIKYFAYSRHRRILLLRHSVPNLSPNFSSRFEWRNSTLGFYLDARAKKWKY